MRAASSERKPKVFLGVSEIAGFYMGLYRGLKAAGCPAVYACNTWASKPPPGRDDIVCEQPWPARLYLRTAAWDARVPKRRRLRKLTARAANYLSRLPLFFYALLTCRVFVYGFGRPLFHHAEMILLRLLRKKIIHVFHGSDNRPPFIDGTLIYNGLPGILERLLRRTRKVRSNVRWIERWGHYSISLAQTAHYHTRPVLDLLGSTGLSVNAPEGERPPKRTDGRLLVLHAPSNPVAKGTERIREMIRRLQGRGYNFVYEEVIGCSQAEVFRKLADCDFVVDACYSETPMSGFVTEAAHFGKPAVVGGYAIEHVRAISIVNGIPAQTYCRPAEMEGMIERLLTNEAFRRECGEQAARFVKEHWSAHGIAERFLRIIDGDIPPEWWFNPAELDYYEGGCLDAPQAVEWTRKFVEAWGVDELGLNHNPRLKARFLDTAGFGAAGKQNPAVSVAEAIP